jgi:hypothetical protein
MPSVDEVDKAVKTAKVVKKTTKKAPVKKSSGGGKTNQVK